MMTATFHQLLPIEKCNFLYMVVSPSKMCCMHLTYGAVFKRNKSPPNDYLRECTPYLVCLSLSNYRVWHCPLKCLKKESVPVTTEALLIFQKVLDKQLFRRGLKSNVCLY